MLRWGELNFKEKIITLAPINVLVEFIFELKIIKPIKYKSD